MLLGRALSSPIKCVQLSGLQRCLSHSEASPRWHSELISHFLKPSAHRTSFQVMNRWIWSKNSLRLQMMVTTETPSLGFLSSRRASAALRFQFPRCRQPDSPVAERALLWSQVKWMAVERQKWGRWKRSQTSWRQSGWNSNEQKVLLDNPQHQVQKSW